MSADLPPVRVALLALPETTLGSLFGLYEVLSAAGVAWNRVTGQAVPARRIEARIVAGHPGPIGSAQGAPILPQGGLDDAIGADAVIVTDVDLSPEGDPRGRWPKEAGWLRSQLDQGATVCSICTGSVLLAEAGLLEGREATSHWAAVPVFAAFYPQVRLHPERILCPTGPEHRIVTGGGAGAWADLALYLIARFCGADEARRIAKLFVLGDRSEGQLPFSALGRSRVHDDAAIGRCQEWLADCYAEANPVARMVGLSGLSERSFKRRFRAATGYAPIDYVQALRIEEAKQLLETTDGQIDTIAGLVGYEDPAFFRRLFKRLTGITPARYRQRYRHIGKPPND